MWAWPCHESRAEGCWRCDVTSPTNKWPQCIVTWAAVVTGHCTVGFYVLLKLKFCLRTPSSQVHSSHWNTEFHHTYRLLKNTAFCFTSQSTSSLACKLLYYASCDIITIITSMRQIFYLQFTLIAICSCYTQPAEKYLSLCAVWPTVQWGRVSVQDTGLGSGHPTLSGYKNTVDPPFIRYKLH